LAHDVRVGGVRRCQGDGGPPLPEGGGTAGLTSYFEECPERRSSGVSVTRACILEGTTVSAHAVAAALRDRLPGLGFKKLHKLLYYCQGHHLAVFDDPLFRETISAWDMGPVVGELWKHGQLGRAPAPGIPLGEAELNTIEYVVSVTVRSPAGIWRS
jgi:hypothetical protein